MHSREIAWESYEEVNSINLTAEALIRDSEELEYYYHNHDVGQIVKDVLQSTNIYK